VTGENIVIIMRLIGKIGEKTRWRYMYQLGIYVLIQVRNEND
jgi:hypothetical protein